MNADKQDFLQRGQAILPSYNLAQVHKEHVFFALMKGRHVLTVIRVL